MLRRTALRRGRAFMRSGPSTGKPTKAQAARFVAMKFDGCLCCIKRGMYGVGPDIHHLKSGNLRRGHSYTIALCKWHHVAQPFDGMTHAECRLKFGPSLAEGSKTFHAAFGSDDELLDEQNARLRDAQASAYDF